MIQVDLWALHAHLQNVQISPKLNHHAKNQEYLKINEK